MKVKSILLLSIVIVLINGCGVPEEKYNKLKLEYNKLVSENTKLIKDLDECRNGAVKLIAKIEKANKDKKYTDAVKNINILYEKFPESSQNKQYQKLLKEIEKKKQEEEAEEKLRLANLNNTGIWSVKFYVDDFGEPTKKGYIINTKKIRGTFSNTATQDSKLDVEFVISGHPKRVSVEIYLYEYAHNNPVKVSSRP